MKNNRLTKEDVLKLRMACDRIRSLASLENAFFSMDSGEDAQVKDLIRPYMTWFECVAEGIGDILDGKEVVPYYFFS
jgi:hypothetical protein